MPEHGRRTEQDAKNVRHPLESTVAGLAFYPVAQEGFE
jgi:hypothetical protein